METYRNRVPILRDLPIRLDLGAGAYPQPGFVRMDQDPCGGATDIVWNMLHGIPLPDWSVIELYTSHCLEHFAPTDVHYILQEMWRVCAPNAKVTIKLPHGDTPEGHLPCHYMRWTEDTMRAIGQWFPPPGHSEHNGNWWNLERIRRESYHLIGEFTIIKVVP